MKDDAADAKDLLTFKWIKGPTLDPSQDLGDPVAGDTGWVLCGYDEVGGVPALAFQANVPPGGTCGGRPCWKATSTGFTYSDRSLASDGVLKVLLKGDGAVPGKSKVIVKGKGANLPLGAGLLPFSQDATVTVQLRSSDAACVQARFSTNQSSSTSSFRAKAD